MRQNPHVRICGGPGSATTLVYPTTDRRQRRRDSDHDLLDDRRLEADRLRDEDGGDLASANQTMTRPITISLTATVRTRWLRSSRSSVAPRANPRSR